MYNPNETIKSLLTKNELLFDKVVGFDRFLELIGKADKIVAFSEDANSFGEFLFVTAAYGDTTICFYGLGYHDQSERYITEEFRFYSGTRKSTDKAVCTIDEAIGGIKDRQSTVTTWAIQDGKHEQSERGILFDYLAELTDEDGALTELEDLGW